MLAALGPLALSSPRQERPPEYGRVSWAERLEPALQRSRASGKPVWLQFQEVPG